MSKAKWIKIVTDIFDDEKMLLIDGMPKADSIIVIWFKLLCLAGKQNNGGVLMASEKIALTDEMLATILHRPLSTVQLALKTFEEFGMIEAVDGSLTIKNWNKHQALEAYEARKESDRLRQAKRREIQAKKHETDDNSGTKKTSECHVTFADASRDVTPVEEEREEEREEDSINNLSASQIDCPFAEIKKLYHEICVSFPKIRAIEGNRRTAVSARWRMHKDLGTFEELFRIAEASSFMKGQNDRNWSANFDWMMNPTNFSKILEHRYDDKAAGENRHPGSFDTDEFFDLAVKARK